MKIIISPSKTMKFIKNTEKENQKLIFEEESKVIMKNLKELDKNDLEKLMKLSSKLSDKTYKIIQNWGSGIKQKALDSYTGMVFNGLNIKEFNELDLEFIKDKLFILSAVYGVLRINNLIEEYRLEMKTKFNIDEYKNLYKFWKDRITNYFNKIAKKDEVLINLASDEYFKVLDNKKLKYNIINISFKEEKEGKFKNVATYAKKARGLMINYIIKNKIDNIEGIKKFDIENYNYNDSLSKENEIIFTR